MAVDPLSPVAPARIRALLLPVGRIKRSRFLNYVELLQQQSLVRLGDISPDPRPDRNMFYPLAFPNGILLYDLSTSLPPASHLSLSPFELFREPLLVIGIGDASEYPWLNSSRESDGAPQSQHEGLEDIQAAIEDIREQFSRAYLHSLMLFDAETQNSHPRLPPETIFVPPTSRLKTTTMKTILCDLTATLLAEMTTLARSIQALPTVASPAAQHGGGGSAPSWASSDHSTAQFSRRNSQTPNSSISESPLSGTQKDHRMSMPVLPSTSGGPSTVDGPRAASPSRQDNRTPPTTFDEISGVNIANVVHQANSNATKASTATKDAASDRVSIHGFGSGSVGERARNKGRGRVSIVVGTLYMCAGQWQDAVSELVDGANRARAFSDHLWHAKALENIMVCMLLFAWSGMDFQIPSLCYPTSDKTAGTKSPQHTPSASVAEISANPGSGNEAALERLNALLPDLINMILNLYTRAANFAGESLPPLAFSECVIRFSKTLAAINLSAGYMDEDTLQHLVLNTPYRQKPRMSVPRLSVHPTRNDVASMLFRALPGPVESVGINTTDRVVVLAGIASVLSSLGLQRKKAIIMKDFITSLIPGLVQARKIGAAEMGVHPAAGLAALNMVSGGASSAGALNLGEGEVESGIEEFLGLLGRIYGIPASKETMPRAKAGSRTLAGQETSESVIADILKTSSLRAFGSVGLKLEVLRMCLNFCEALPDFNGVLHFTALLLRMAGPGTAPRPNSTDVFVSLPRDEQVKLFSNISRTVVAANKLGLQHEETEYWDDFLVRGLFILEEPVPLRLIHHRPAELKLTTSRNEGPFLHNPWLKKPQPSAVETVLVANEEYRFLIALQNPYDFELELDSLRIAAEGVHFVAVEKHFFLGPYRTQKFQIAGVAQSAGTIKIIGCYVKVIGCRERLFPIFPEPWKPMRESKMKRTGLTACLGAPASRPSSAMAPLTHRTPASEPKPDSLTFNIIPDQPIVVITDVSLPQSSLMVLEGERVQFTVTVKNTSQTTAVDFVHITFQDSATSAIQAATTNKGLPPAELHELEVQLAHYPSLRWCKDTDEETINIKPGEKIDFTIEVIGRTRLMDAVVQIDYANLGKRRSEVDERFFTRQVSVPIFITVNASVQLQRPDLVPLSSDFAWTESTRSNHLHSITHHLDRTRDQEHCMLLLDLRNSWPNPLSISLFLDPPSTSSDPPPSSPPVITEIIQPGHVHRIALILPKLHLPTAHAPIPSLNPATTRQFVVSASKISPEAERLTREAFWYRDALLRRVRGTWAEDDGTAARHGELELRSLRLSARMLDAVKLDDVKISMSVRADDDDNDDDNDRSSSMRTPRKREFQVDVDGFYTLKTTIENRSTRAISPLLRLQPHLKDLAHTVALDLDKRFSWTGALQAKLPVLQPGGECVYELGIVALCSGAFEMGATVDEAELLQSEDEGRQRSDTQSLLQRDVIGEPKLRSWVLKEPCVIVARRGER